MSLLVRAGFIGSAAPGPADVRAGSAFSLVVVADRSKTTPTNGWLAAAAAAAINEASHPASQTDRQLAFSDAEASCNRSTVEGVLARCYCSCCRGRCCCFHRSYFFHLSVISGCSE